MKTRSVLFFSTLCALMLGIGFPSCSIDLDDDEPIIGDSIVYPAYILNEGLWGSNNANISMFIPQATITSAESDYYQKVNGKKMGDVANALIKKDYWFYAVLNGSKYASRIDTQTLLEQARYTFPENEGAPRCIDVNGEYVYVTQYGGQVSKLNYVDMTLAGTFNGGDNLEGIVAHGTKLYVANSYKGINDYNQEVFVIDSKTMTLEKTIQVILNPTKMHEIDNKIYLISAGNYYDVPGALQVFDAEKETFTPLLNDVTKITKGNDGLVYGVVSKTDWSTNPASYVHTFFTYNPKNNQVDKTSFLQDVPSSLSNADIYLLEVDEYSGYIYVGTSDYVNTGTIYQFNKEGKFLQKFDSGGINPSALVFRDF